MRPRTPPPLRIALSLIGLVAVGASFLIAFFNPFGTWHWALLIVAVACLIASRRVR
jgi:hypothetical protein